MNIWKMLSIWLFSCKKAKLPLSLSYSRPESLAIVFLSSSTPLNIPEVQFSPVAQLCPTLCHRMDCSTPGFSVHHQLPELTQIHVHRVNDAIQPSHPLSSLSSPAFNLSQDQVFSKESVLLIRWPKYWSFSFSISLSNEYSGLISFRMDWLDLPAVKGLSRVFSNTTVQKHQFFCTQLL